MALCLLAWHSLPFAVRPVGAIWGSNQGGDGHPWEEKVCPSGGLDKIGILHTERVTSVS